MLPTRQRARRGGRGFAFLCRCRTLSSRSSTTASFDLREATLQIQLSLIVICSARWRTFPGAIRVPQHQLFSLRLARRYFHEAAVQLRFLDAPPGMRTVVPSVCLLFVFYFCYLTARRSATCWVARRLVSLFVFFFLVMIISVRASDRRSVLFCFVWTSPHATPPINCVVFHALC